MTETSAAMEGKIVLVTGGIGKATATALAGLGARVIVVGRSRARGETGAADIKTESGNGDVELILADPSSQAEVRRLAGEFEARHDRLDVLVNNVGACTPSAGRRRTGSRRRSR